MKKILITGKSSYVGTHVKSWLGQYPQKYQVDVISVRGSEWKKRDFSEYDVIFHVAGIAHSDIGNATEELKERYYSVNTDLAIGIAKKAKGEGVRQFIFMSSIIIYGTETKITKDTKPAPENFYGDSKWQADQQVRALADERFCVAVVRAPMIYGANSKGNFPKLVKMAQKLPIFPMVKNQRSMIYIDNLSECIRLLIDQEMGGCIFPQNKDYVNTSELVRAVAQKSHHKIWMSRVLAPAAMIGLHMPRKIGQLCNKVFGSKYYEQSMSQLPEGYQLIDFEESVRRSIVDE